MNSPRLVKSGIVQVDPASGRTVGVIALQYNPDSVSRTLQVQASAGDGADKSQALRLKGAAVETIKVDAEIDATDRLEFPDQNQTTVAAGIHPQIAALELLVQPTSAALQANDALSRSGVLEVLPLQAPLTLFVWGRNRVVPVRVTDLSVTEEAFDANLNPIRAKVSLGLRVLSVDDLGFDHRGGTLFMGYLRTKEGLASRAASVAISALGIEGIPT
jgi:Contractile injection system tube protein